MRKSRKIWTLNRAFFACFTVACVAYSPSNAQVGEALPLDDPNAVMEMLISAVKAIEQPATGRGTAMIKIENVGVPFEGKDLTVDFVFKDQKSRVDIFESEAEGRGSRLQAIARSDKGFLNVLQHEVFVDRLEFYPDEVGRDFHPDTFFTFLGGMSLVEWFEYQLDPPEPRVISVELDHDDILHVSVRIHVVVPKRPGRAAKEYDSEGTIRFDTQEGLRPVFFESKSTYSDGSWRARRANLQWAKFGSTWYVSAFECHNLPSNHRHTVGTVKKFSPNVEVSDKEFTLDGMDVPDGMRVNDMIAGVRYRYEAAISLMEDPNRLERAQPAPLERADGGKQEAFLDAQMLIDGWEASYCHIDSYKVRYAKIMLDEKGQNPSYKIARSIHQERIQDGRKFLVRTGDSPQAFDGTGDYAIRSFDGSIGKGYLSDLSGRNPGRGTIYRGLSGKSSEIMNLLGYFLESVPDLANKPTSREGPRWKVLKQQYPLGIPIFLRWYNSALEAEGVKVRPYLESVAGESCHVLELDFKSHSRTYWFAHEKGMLPMKKRLVLGGGKVATKEVKEIVSVTTDTGILWYPRVIMEEQIKGPNYSYTMKVTVDEFVPYFKAPAETFSYVFPNGTRVWDKIKDLRYRIGDN